MATIPSQFLGKVAGLPPAERERLDGLGNLELLSRLLYVEHLDEQMRRIADPALSRGYAEISAKVLGALPRAEVERRAAELRKTATSVLAAHDATYRAGVWGQLTMLNRNNPETPSKFVEAAQARIDEEAARRTPTMLHKGRRTAAADVAAVLYKAAHAEGVDPAAADAYRALARSLRK